MQIIGEVVKLGNSGKALANIDINRNLKIFALLKIQIRQIIEGDKE